MRKRPIKQQPTTPPPQPVFTAPTLTIQDDIDDFLLDREAQQISASTLKWHRTALARLREYCEGLGITETRAIDARTLRTYIKQLEQLGHNPGGISHLYRSPHAFLTWYSNEYDVYEMHATLRKVRLPSRNDDPLDPISLQDFNAMVAQCEPRTFVGERDRAILYVLLDTGIRHQELTDL